MIKILCLHNATDRASYRYRVAHFLPYWNSYHIDLQASCISGKQYINILRFLFKFQDYDYILLQKKILPQLLIKIIARKSMLVYDFDDAIYTRESWLLKKNKPQAKATVNNLNFIIKKAAIVFAGSNDLVNYAKKFNNNIYLIPTALDKQIPDTIITPKSGNVMIGWIGNDVNLFYLAIIDEATFYLQQKYPDIRFALMCGNPPKGLKTQWEFMPWSSATEKTWLQSIDIGIMPLTDDPWTRGKCAFKLLQYMAFAKPVIASDVGANRTTVLDSINGYLVSTPAGWASALEALILDQNKRIAMGRESLRIFNEHFERSHIQQKIADILHEYKHPVVSGNNIKKA
ncbi:MAG: glycosyltransferase family 4 protein [Chlorobiaceae bacterium]